MEDNFARNVIIARILCFLLAAAGIAMPLAKLVVLYRDEAQVATATEEPGIMSRQQAELITEQLVEITHRQGAQDNSEAAE
jgi:hypothetical protein